MTTQRLPETPTLAPAAAVVASRAPRRADHRFYAWAGAAAFAIVLAGFARTYYLKLLFGTPVLPALLHLHGALMSSWFALFFTQTYLVASHRVRIHRRLGVFGAVLAGLIVVVGATVALRFGAREMNKPQVAGPPALAFMGFLLAALLVFALLVGAALLLRRRRDFHTRLMLLSCFFMVGPALARIPLEQFPVVAFLKTGGPGGLFGLDLLPVYAFVAWDTWRHRRLHRAFIGGALLIIAAEDPAKPISALSVDNDMDAHRNLAGESDRMTSFRDASVELNRADGGTRTWWEIPYRLSHHGASCDFVPLARCAFLFCSAMLIVPSCRSRPNRSIAARKDLATVHLRLGGGPALPRRNGRPEQSGVDPRPRCPLRAVGGERRTAA